MQLAQVKGCAVATAKSEALAGRRLLVVELADVEGWKLSFTQKHMVCLDAVGAGAGDLVLVVEGSSARFAGDMGAVPADAVIVGIVDSIRCGGGELLPEEGRW